jgi:two-component system chemotaxis response regulator CheY
MASKILIVDDSRTTRTILRRALASLGVSTGSMEEAGDGAQALERLRRGGVDTLLLDLNMPVMNGLQLLAALRDEARLHGLAVIVISSEADAATRDLHALGVTEILCKPFEPGQLIPALERARAVALVENEA